MGNHRPLNASAAPYYLPTTSLPPPYHLLTTSLQPPYQADDPSQAELMADLDHGVLGRGRPRLAVVLIEQFLHHTLLGHLVTPWDKKTGAQKPNWYLNKRPIGHIAYLKNNSN